MHDEEVGFWGTAELLIEPLPEDIIYPTFLALAFLKEASDRSVIKVSGYKGNSEERTVIPANILPSLEFDILAFKGDGQEPSEASARPNPWLASHQNHETYHHLRFSRREILILRPAFIVWTKNGQVWPQPEQSSIEIADARLRKKGHAKSFRAAFAATHWSLLATLTWIHTRNPELVSMALDAECAGTKSFGMQEIEISVCLDTGFIVPKKSREEFYGIRVFYQDAGGPTPTIKDAKKELIEELESGRLTAFGLRHGTGQLNEISAKEWTFLMFADQPPSAIPKPGSFPYSTRWERIIFPYKDIIRGWPGLDYFRMAGGVSASGRRNSEFRLLDFTDFAETLVEAFGPEKTCKELVSLLLDGSLSVEAEMQKTYSIPVSGKPIREWKIDRPSIITLPRDWWLYGQATIDLRGRLCIDPSHPPVLDVLHWWIKYRIPKYDPRLQLVLNLQTGSRMPHDPHEISGARCLAVELSRVAKLWPEVFAEIQKEDSEQETVEQTKRGSGFKFDWPTFYDAAIDILDDEGMPNPTSGGSGWSFQADLERRMADWCEEHWSTPPVESTIRSHVKIAISKFYEMRKASN